MPELLQQAKAIAKQVFTADLAGAPLYVVQPEMGEHVGGFYSAANDSIFRLQLEAAGEWRGSGICVAVCIDAPEYQSLEDDRDRQCWILGVVLHELAHWVDHPAEKVQPRERTAEHAVVDFEKIEARLADPLPASRLPWLYRSHGQSFTRLACHAWHRANMLFPITPDWLIFGNCYPSLGLLESPRTYVDALRTELQEYPITSPLRVLPWGYEAPATFTDLWRSTSLTAAGIAYALNGD